MKVLFDASFFTGVQVGIARCIIQIARHLGHRCDLTVLTSCPEQFEGMPGTLVRIPHWTSTHRGRVAWALAVLPRYCAPPHDALISPTPLLPPFSRIPTVAIVHDVTPLVMHRVIPSRYKALFWLSLQTLRRADAVIADSEHTRRDLLHLGVIPPSRTSVVPMGPGITPSAADNGFAEQFRPFVLYVGGHMPTKNVPRLLDAFSRVRVRTAVRLVIVGWGSSEHNAATQRAIAELGLMEEVVILQTLSEAELSSLYRRCEILVFPSLYEGFGLPVLEAMGHGAPTLCSWSSSLPEVAGDAVLYFNPRSAADMAEKIALALSDQALNDRLRIRGPVRAAEFSWERTASAIMRTAESAVRDQR